MRVSVLLIFLLFVPNKLYATSSDVKVSAMLKSNTIVQAAVSQAKEFSGARDCKYSVKTHALAQFEVDTAFDYEAEITCNSIDPNEEAAGIVRVHGQLIGDGPQGLTLEILFAE